MPVSWYGVARPRALSGFAGTMMSQLTFAAVVVAVPEPDGAVDGAADGEALADAPTPSAALPRSVTVERPATMITAPITRPNTTGIAIVTAIRGE